MQKIESLGTTSLALKQNMIYLLMPQVHFVYKKVAVVENFFDIIYSVHVESSGKTVQLRGRAGKHCGQKRTYRAVSTVLLLLSNGTTKPLLSLISK